MKFFKDNLEHIVDIGILVLSILFTLHIENKFNGFEWVQNNYWLIAGLLIFIILRLTIFKMKLNRKEKNLLEENLKLEQENEYLENLISLLKYQISKPLEDLLHEISIELKFNSNHRITVYTYTNGCFFSIARYSQNPLYRSFGRIAIKDSDEFIFKVWRGEEDCQTNKVDPQRKMPTQKICVHFLYEKNEKHPKKDKIGLVVFESTENKNKQFNKGKFSEQVLKINEFIQSNLNLKQDLSFAMKEGL